MIKAEKQQKKEIGERIALIRGKKSQPKFALKLGVSKNTIIRYEKGEGVPDLALATKICDQNNINLAWLAFGDGPMLRGDTEQCKHDIPINREGHMFADYPAFEPGLLGFIFDAIKQYEDENDIKLTSEQAADISYLAFIFCQEDNKNEARIINYVFSMWDNMDTDKKKNLYL